MRGYPFTTYFGFRKMLKKDFLYLQDLLMRREEHINKKKFKTMQYERELAHVQRCLKTLPTLLKKNDYYR